MQTLTLDYAWTAASRWTWNKLTLINLSYAGICDISMIYEFDDSDTMTLILEHFLFISLGNIVQRCQYPF